MEGSWFGVTRWIIYSADAVLRCCVNEEGRVWVFESRMNLVVFSVRIGPG